MPFGVAGGPSTFNGAHTTTLKPANRVCIISFFDDILVFSKTFSDHLQHLTLVLQLLRKDHWQVKQSKCSFAQRQISYLGHVINEQGVSTDPTKIQTI